MLDIFALFEMKGSVQILLYIYDHPDGVQKVDLRNNLDVSPSTTINIQKKLYEAGLVATRASFDKILLVLTARGTNIAKHLRLIAGYLDEKDDILKGSLKRYSEILSQSKDQIKDLITRYRFIRLSNLIRKTKLNIQDLLAIIAKLVDERVISINDEHMTGIIEDWNVYLNSIKKVDALTVYKSIQATVSYLINALKSMKVDINEVESKFMESFETSLIIESNFIVDIGEILIKFDELDFDSLILLDCLYNMKDNEKKDWTVKFEKIEQLNIQIQFLMKNPLRSFARELVKNLYGKND